MAGRLEFEFDVNATVAGQDWRVRLRHNGEVYARIMRTTNHRGNFEVERMVTDVLGTDTLGARAVNLKTSQVCAGHVSI